MGFELASASFDVCTQLKGVTCPLPANVPFTGKMSYNIPQAAPDDVQLTTRIELLDPVDDTKYSCVEVSSLSH